MTKLLFILLLATTFLFMEDEMPETWHMMGNYALDTRNGEFYLKYKQITISKLEVKPPGSYRMLTYTKKIVTGGIKEGLNPFIVGNELDYDKSTAVGYAREYGYPYIYDTTNGEKFSLLPVINLEDVKSKYIKEQTNILSRTSKISKRKAKRIAIKNWETINKKTTYPECFYPRWHSMGTFKEQFEKRN